MLESLISEYGDARSTGNEHDNRDKIAATYKALLEAIEKVAEKERAAIIQLLETKLPREFNNREAKLALLVAVNAIQRKEHRRL